MEFSQWMDDRLWESWIGSDMFGIEKCGQCKEKFKEEDAVLSLLTNDCMFCCNDCCEEWEEQFRVDNDL